MTDLSRRMFLAGTAAALADAQEGRHLTVHSDR
jgi:hypothetical protein